MSADRNKRQLFERTRLFEQLVESGFTDWAVRLQQQCDERFARSTHGTFGEWTAAWRSLPDVRECAFHASGPTVRVTTDQVIDNTSLRKSLMGFHPWRKGPFQLFDTFIDCEWRSDLKWDRVVGCVDFHDKRVLDVGCGNGYYGWRMLDAGARLVIGCDPFLLYVAQFEVLRKYAPLPERHFVIPVGDSELPDNLRFFDISLSMGVLYHRTSPIDHLLKMASTLRAGGVLILETLVLDTTTAEVLVPEGRYAKMRNVWFIPSIALLETWLRRCGFQQIEVRDLSTTTPQEQRKTEWMTFESLSDFLSPDDSSLTIEGYPAPRRALLTATVTH